RKVSCADRAYCQPAGRQRCAAALWRGHSMTDEPEPEFTFAVSTAEIEAAIKRGDYGWLIEHVFNPALLQFLEKKNTAALLTNPRPRARRAVGERRSHRSRRLPQVPG